MNLINKSLSDLLSEWNAWSMALSSHWLWKEKYVRKEKNAILVFLSNWHYLMESNLCCAKVCRKVWEELDEGAIQQILFYEMLWLNKGQTKNSAISHIAFQAKLCWNPYCEVLIVSFNFLWPDHGNQQKYTRRVKIVEQRKEVRVNEDGGHCHNN